MATGSEVSLTTDQRVELSSIAQSRSLPAGYVFRAKLILMLAEGTPFNTIKRRLQTSAPTIIRWKQRFLQSGLDGPSRPEGHGADAGIAGPDSVGHPQETSRWFHALELPQTGGDAEREQRRRASGLERKIGRASCRERVEMPGSDLVGKQPQNASSRVGRHR